MIQSNISFCRTSYSVEHFMSSRRAVVDPPSRRAVVDPRSRRAVVDPPSRRAVVDPPTHRAAEPWSTRRAAEPWSTRGSMKRQKIRKKKRHMIEYNIIWSILLGAGQINLRGARRLRSAEKRSSIWLPGWPAVYGPASRALAARTSQARPAYTCSLHLSLVYIYLYIYICIYILYIYIYIITSSGLGTCLRRVFVSNKHFLGILDMHKCQTWRKLT